MAKRPPDVRAVAEEILRRAGKVDEHGNRVLPYVIHLSEPPTASQRLQLAAVRLLGRPVAIMPVPCATVEEWAERHGRVTRD